jgi:hypothetical protein
MNSWLRLSWTRLLSLPRAQQKRGPKSMPDKWALVKLLWWACLVCFTYCLTALLLYLQVGASQVTLVSVSWMISFFFARVLSALLTALLLYLLLYCKKRYGKYARQVGASQVTLVSVSCLFTYCFTALLHALLLEKSRWCACLVECALLPPPAPLFCPIFVFFLWCCYAAALCLCPL